MAGRPLGGQGRGRGLRRGGADPRSRRDRRRPRRDVDRGRVARLEGQGHSSSWTPRTAASHRSARAVAGWMGAAPEVRWIVTSRSRIGVEGEAVLDLGPLAVAGGGTPDAVWLFLDRARAARADLPLDERTARDVLELVRRLDGFRSPSSSPRRGRGRSRPPRCSSRSRAGSTCWAPPRTTPTRGTRRCARRSTRRGTCWSHGRRTPWPSCPCSRGASTSTRRRRSSTSRLTPARHRGLEALEALRDRSLLTAAAGADDGGRLRFSTYGSVREYARERLLLQGGREAAVLRHARHYVAVGGRWAELHDEGTRARGHGVARARDGEPPRRAPAHAAARSRRRGARGRGGAGPRSPARGGGPRDAPPRPARRGARRPPTARTWGSSCACGPERRAPTRNRLMGRGQDAMADAQAALTLATSSGARDGRGARPARPGDAGPRAGQAGRRPRLARAGLHHRSRDAPAARGRPRARSPRQRLGARRPARRGVVHAGARDRRSTGRWAICASRPPTPGTWPSSRTTPAASQRPASTATARWRCAGRQATAGSRPRSSGCWRR